MYEGLTTVVVLCEASPTTLAKRLKKTRSGTATDVRDESQSAFMSDGVVVRALHDWAFLSGLWGLGVGDGIDGVGQEDSAGVDATSLSGLINERWHLSHSPLGQIRVFAILVKISRVSVLFG